MKKIILLTYILILGLLTTANAQNANSGTQQQPAEITATETALYNDTFNRWSVEFMAGINRPLTPFATGYYSTNSSKMVHIGGFRHFSLGTRYMLSHSFGVRLDLAYDKFTDPKDSGSLPFNTSQYMFELQGVLNLGHIFDFRSFTQRFGLLAHMGGQLSRFVVNEGAFEGSKEFNGGFIFGLTPQFKLNERFTIMADWGYELNIKQHRNWDGSSRADNNLVGNKITMSVGLAYNFGKHDKHADWIVKQQNITNGEVYAALLDKINELEQQQQYSPVNTEPIVTRQDEMEQDIVDINNRIDNLPILENNGDNTPIDGKYDVFFDLNSDFVSTVYIPAIAETIDALKKDPNKSVVIEGYTDVRGNEKWNSRLSKRRAKAVARLLEQGGINASRITTKGKGVDNKYNTTTTDGMQLNRRATIRIQ